MNGRLIAAFGIAAVLMAGCPDDAPTVAPADTALDAVLDIGLPDVGLPDAGKDAIDAIDAVPDGDSTTDGSPDGVDPNIIDAPLFERTANAFILRIHEWGMGLEGRVFADEPGGFHEEAAREGFCRLLTYDAASCPTLCDYPTACHAGECVTSPQPIGIGPVTLSGAGPTPFVLDPGTYNNYWVQSTDITSATPMTTLTLSADGSAGPGFALTVAPVISVVQSGNWDAQLEARADGEDVTIAWTNANAGDRIYLRMTTGIGTHGGVSPVEVECDAPDTGALTLPGAYLDALFADGWSCGECAYYDLYRYQAATSDTVPPIRFETRASTGFYFHPNF